MTALLLVVALQTGAATGAGAPIATSTIRGRVVRPGGLPLPRAQVRLSDANRPGPPRATAMTDENGAYEFTDLPAGSYRMAASKTGYLTMQYGRRGPSELGEPFRVAPGETRDHIDVVLPRHGALSGRIVDENGDPVEGIRVTALQIRFTGGRRQLAPVVGVGSRRTNDLGRYRVYGLEPGEYYVSAQAGDVASGDLPGYAETYLPGTLNPGEARSVRVGVAEEVEDLDFTLVPVRTARVAGTTVSSAGEPFQGGVQMRASRRAGVVAANPFGARTKADGSFEFLNVPPGEFVIYAVKNAERGWHAVTVNGDDVSGLVVQTLPGSTVTGRVVFDGPGTPRPRDLEIATVPADADLTPFAGDLPAANVRDDWTFSIESLSGPRRFHLRRAPPGWALAAIRIDGMDVTDSVFAFGTAKQALRNVDIVLTDRPTRVAGTVTDGRGNAAADCVVIAFAPDRDRWYAGSRHLASARPKVDGTFAIEGLPAGDYRIAVDRPGDADAWQDPALLDRLARDAASVRVTDGESITINLRSAR